MIIIDIMSCERSFYFFQLKMQYSSTTNNQLFLVQSWSKCMQLHNVRTLDTSLMRVYSVSKVCIFSTCTAAHSWTCMWEGLQAVTHAVDCSDSRLCGEDSVVQCWLNPCDSGRRRVKENPKDNWWPKISFMLDKSWTANQVKFLSYLRYLSKPYCLNVAN